MPGGYVGARPKDESKLSREPSQIRNRLRRKATQPKAFKADLEMLIEAGYKPVEDWDLEELARGKPRDKDGKFRGRPSRWITSEVAQEAKKRLVQETLGGLSTHVHSAIKTIAWLLTCDEVDDKGKLIVDPATKLKAAMFVIENIAGKPKAVVEVEAADFTRRMIASAIILDDGTPQDDRVVLEGQIVDDDEDEEDDADSE